MFKKQRTGGEKNAGEAFQGDAFSTPASIGSSRGSVSLADDISSLMETFGNKTQELTREISSNEKTNAATSLVESLLTAVDPTEALQSISFIVHECLNNNKDESATPKPLPRALYRALTRSIIILCARNDLASKPLLVDRLLAHFKMCVEVYVDRIVLESLEMFEMMNALLSYGSSCDLLQVCASDQVKVKKFLETSEYCFTELCKPMAPSMEDKDVEKSDENRPSTGAPFLELVEYFCKRGGVTGILDFIAGKQKPNKPSTSQVQRFIVLLLLLGEFLRPSVERQIIPSLRESVVDYFLGLDNNEIKHLERTSFVDTLTQLHKVLRKTGESVLSIRELTEKLRLEVALKQLRCPFMQQRLAGLKEIRTLVDELESKQTVEMYLSEKTTASSKQRALKRGVPGVNASDQSAKKRQMVTNERIEQPTDDDDTDHETNSNAEDGGSRVEGPLDLINTRSNDSSALSPQDPSDVSQPSDDGTWSDAKRSAAAQQFEQLWLDADFLCSWFKQNKFAEMLFSPEYMHVELLKRSGSIFHFLANENKLTEEDLTVIWDTARGVDVHESIKDTVFLMIAELARWLHPDILMFLWNKLAAIPLDEHDPKSLVLVHSFTLNAVSSNHFRAVTSKHGTWFGLDLFWKVVQDDTPCSPQVHKIALRYLIDLCGWQPCATAREQFLNACVSNLLKSFSVPQSLRLFRKIVTTFRVGVTAGPYENNEPATGRISVLGANDQPISREKIAAFQPELIKACLNDLRNYKLKCIEVIRNTPRLHKYVLNKTVLIAPGSTSSTDDSSLAVESAMVDDEESFDDTYDDEDDDEDDLEDEGMDWLDDEKVNEPPKEKQQPIVNPIDSLKLVGKYSHLKGVRIRLKFLRFVLISNGSNNGTLNSDQVSALLEYVGRLALTHKERDVLLAWMIQIHCAAQVFSIETAQKSLLQWFKQFSLSSLRSRAFSFFNYFFRVVNMDMGRMKSKRGQQTDKPANLSKLSSPYWQTVNKNAGGINDTLDFTVLNPHLFGIGMLWSMALKASNTKVSSRASQMLCVCYASVSKETDAEKSIETLSSEDDRVMVAGGWCSDDGDGRVKPEGLLVGGFVREAIAQLKQALEYEKSSNSVKVVVRCLSLLKNLQNTACNTSMMQSTHGAMVKLTNRDANILSSFDKDLILLRIKPIDSQEFTIHLPFDASLYRLRKVVGTSLKLDPMILRFIAEGKELKAKDELQPFGKFTNNQVIHVVPRPASHIQQHLSSSSSSPPPSPVKVILPKAEAAKEDTNVTDPKTEGHSNDAFELLKESDNVKLLTGLIFRPEPNELLATHTWSLLMDMPTNPQLFQAIHDLTVDWEDLLDHKCVYKLLYALQIMHFFLNKHGIEASQADDWAAKVVTSGGLTKLIHSLEYVQDPTSPLNVHSLGPYCVLLLVCNIMLLSKNEKAKADYLQIVERHGSSLNTSIFAGIRHIAMKKRNPHSNERRSKSNNASTIERTIETDIVVKAMQLSSELTESYPSCGTQGFFGPGDVNCVEWVHDCLLRSENISVKFNIVAALKKMHRYDHSMLVGLFSFIDETENEAHIHFSSPYFHLLQHLINEAVATRSEDISKWIQNTLLVGLVDKIKSHPGYEDGVHMHGGVDSGQEVCDQTMLGLLQTTKKCLSALGTQEARTLAQSHGLINYVFEICLFQIDDYGLKSPKCRSRQCREAGFALLLEASDGCNDNLKRMFSLIEAQHKQTDLGPGILAGLVDYLKMPSSKMVIYEPGRNREKIRDRERLWHYAPSPQSKADCGYVGLRNLGCTCYMNSLLQQLFMIPRFRYSILGSKDSGKRLLEKDSSNSTESDVEAEREEEKKREQHKELLYQTMRMFSYLQESEKKFYDTAEFCAKSLSLNHGQPVDIFEQHDVDEFFNVLMDQLERALELKTDPHVMRDLFGGVLCNQIICREGCNHRSEREENFMVCQLEVKGKLSIKQSLDLYVEGELLEGDNKYLCGECNEKRDAQKRACFVKLPQVLIMHLKRFEFDLELLRKIKVNDHCEFPMDIDMKKYTKEGLEEEAGLASPNDQQEKDDEYYQYELKGILVHTGTADSGHYYSYIKERYPVGGRTDCEWFCFNDESVTPFDTSSIPQNCFGGLDCSMQWDPSQAKHNESWSPKPFSAYLLIYERKGFSQMDSSKYNASMLREVVPQQFRLSCGEENLEFLRDQHLFDPQYTKFIHNAVALARKSPTLRDSTTATWGLHGVLYALGCYTFNTLAHAKDKTAFTDMMSVMNEFLGGDFEAARCTLLSLCEANGGTIIKQLLLRCTIQSVREQSAAFLTRLLTENIEDQRQIYGSPDEWMNNAYSVIPPTTRGCVGNATRAHVESEILEQIGVTRCPEAVLGNALWQDCLLLTSVPPVQSVVVRVVGWMVGFITECSQHWKTFYQFFYVLDQFASLGKPERLLLINIGTISRLLEFILGTNSPALKATDPALAESIDNFPNRVEMGDKYVQVKLGPMVHLLANLVDSCNVSSVQLDEPDTRPNLLRLDLHMLLHTSAIQAMISSDADVKDVERICVHLCRGDWTNSRIVISALVVLLQDLSTSSFDSVFRVLESCLEIENDELQEKRVLFAMGDLLRLVKEDCKYEVSVISSCVFYITSLVLNSKMDLVATWLFAQRAKWMFDWLVSHESAQVRRNTAALVLLLCDRVPAQDGKSPSYLIVQELLNFFLSEESRPYASAEHYGDIRLAANELPSTTLGLTGLRSWTSPSSSSLGAVRNGVRVDSTEDGTGSDVGAKMVKVVRGGPMEPQFFHLVAICKAIVCLFEHFPVTRDSDVLNVERFNGIIQMALRIDEYKLECDWNKGELLILVGKMLEYSRDLVHHLVTSPHLDGSINISMTVRPTEEHHRFNEKYAPAYYELFSTLVRDPIHGKDITSRFLDLHHLNWAVRYYFLDTNEYERTAEPLFFLIRACIAASPRIWRTRFLQVMTPQDELVRHLSKGGVLNRIMTMKHALEFNIFEDEEPHHDVVLRIRADRGPIKVEDVKTVRQDFFESEGMTYLSSLIMRFFNCETVSRIGGVDSDEARTKQLVIILQTLKHALDALLSICPASDDPEDEHSYEDEKLLSQVVSMWANRADLVTTLLHCANDVDTQKKRKELYGCLEDCIHLIIDAGKHDSNISETYAKLLQSCQAYHTPRYEIETKMQETPYARIDPISSGYVRAVDKIINRIWGGKDQTNPRIRHLSLRLAVFLAIETRYQPENHQLVARTTLRIVQQAGDGAVRKWIRAMPMVKSYVNFLSKDGTCKLQSDAAELLSIMSTILEEEDDPPLEAA
uniref:ubiquitinyl hydrolase 1 n=1 Tax=Mucochytrium quahogii TaxID=96639 RepID=A0A7S2RGE2_9STRA|mmetsp:Transcript_45142/g.72181  ORF Transcript_45142/g.72181 Transcript_45142/m.72181 type:complete len:3286 (+) Transcript_45142:485-10342(+)|eukprot:CAMPEP_0203744584 /NCGR_PEP_ID=MMETSP0098-20131031/591_1 /ASSEMBLY_ACC=CAM_ASM_000208 /TAXON_ID=96639 /ORGANISM=" , Strain NY0313808BC1" /LENGTH=3285 /DNA_ID=CAMNT_0050632141 /DNA_START=493 /DNA_END=10350 /DNA_ORIENTATION=+